MEQDSSKAKNSKGLGCVYKSLFRIFVPKKKVRLTKGKNTTENGIELIQPGGRGEREILIQTGGRGDAEVNKTVNGANTCQETETQNPSPEFQSMHNDGYLPNLYTASEDEPQDFAREMLLGRACQFDPSCESPMSLASAFRRSMSPTSSDCAGSELSYVQALVNAHQTKNTNVAQHVGWLQEHFHSPNRTNEER